MRKDGLLSCPDWKDLTARRDSDVAAEAEWERALEHFDRCERCHEEAFAAEPTLLFRALPGLEASPAELAGIKQGVAALRRNQERERPAAASRRRWRYLRMAAVNAAVLVGATLLATQLFQDGPGAVTPVTDLATVDATTVDATTVDATTVDATTADATRDATTDPESIPLLEDVDPAFETPIQMMVDDVPVLQASQPRDLRFEVRVLRAGTPDAGTPDAGTPDAGTHSEEIVDRLRGVLRYDDYQVLAESAGTGREGEETSLVLGEGYQVSFKLAEVLAGERLRLEGFRVTRQLPMADKGRQLPPRDLFHATVNLWMTKPLTLVLTDETSQEALVVAITCRPAERTERIPRADR